MEKYRHKAKFEVTEQNGVFLHNGVEFDPFITLIYLASKSWYQKPSLKKIYYKDGDIHMEYELTPEKWVFYFNGDRFVWI